MWKSAAQRRWCRSAGMILAVGVRSNQNLLYFEKLRTLYEIYLWREGIPNLA